MSFLTATCPYFPALVRREYTRGLRDGHGSYLRAYAIAVRCRRGRMLDFQVVFEGTSHRGRPANTGGAMYLVPLQALCSRPCAPPKPQEIAPYDVFSDTFTVAQFELLAGMRCQLLPRRLPARYLFTLDFAHSDIADDPEQHKHLHVLSLEHGPFAAVPNNRLLLDDPALWDVTTQRPSFRTLANEFTSE